MNRIALHGVPRSGTTWLGEIINSCPSVQYAFQPLFSYAFKDFLGTEPDRERIARFFDSLLETEDAFVRQTENRAAGILPRFTKGEIDAVAYKEVRYHYLLPKLLESGPDIKAVLVLRNPLSVMASWLNAPREFRGDLGWERLEEWRYAPRKNLNRVEEYHGFERWKAATRLFLEVKGKWPDQVTLVNYNELLADRERVTTQLFERIQLPYTRQTETFLRESHVEQSDHPYGVFRVSQTDDKWKSTLEEEIVHAIVDDLMNTDLEYMLPETARGHLD